MKKNNGPPPLTFTQLNKSIESCTRCPRLVKHCRSVAEKKRKAYRDFDYWGKPVANFGSARADLLVVGLAPGAHGANRTGRMFTGDRSGDWLFSALHRAGFANQPNSEHKSDGLKLSNCAITNICHCAPPDNKPLRQELDNCQSFLLHTIQLVRPRVFLALGGLAWKAMVDIAIAQTWLDNPKPRPKFGHGNKIDMRSVQTPPQNTRRWLVGSYHVSQQNTFTGRLTEAMLDDVFNNIKSLLKTESRK